MKPNHEVYAASTTASGVGVRVIASHFMPRTKVVAELPKREFIEYEPSDWPWLAYFGLLRERDTGEPYFVMVNGCLTCHPDNIELLKQRMKDAVAMKGARP